MKKILWLVAVCCLGGCKDAPQARQEAQDVVLTGVVVRKDWSKSLESWSAGGSEYFVLKPEASVPVSGGEESENVVILRPSETVPFDSFGKFEGRRVTCRGRYVAGERYVPDHNSVDQVPGPGINPITGEEEYPMVGSGFQVNVIEASGEKPGSPK